MKRLILGLIAVAVLILSFAVALFVIDTMTGGPPSGRVALEPTPPLPVATRTSQIVTPVAVSLSAIGASMDAAAPRDFSGTGQNPLGRALQKATLDWTLARGAMAVSGRGDAMSVSIPLNGTLRVAGEIGPQAGQIGAVIGDLLGSRAGKAVQNLQGKAFDQSAAFTGNVTVTSRPRLLPEWRLDPVLAAQVALSEGGINVAGIRLSAPQQVKPVIDQQVNQQLAALQARVRNDPLIETTARREWAKMCRSFPIGGTGGAPQLYLEMKPTRAYAAQPSVDATALTLTIGVQAETRIVPEQTKPECPFPARLEIVQQTGQGSLNVGVPIDIPFSEINRQIEAQLKGKTFPEGSAAAGTVTVKKASVAASGERLLISLDVTAKETTSWFGLGTDAIVHVWGKPVIDAAQQTLKFTDIAVDIDAGGIGVLTAAARAAAPYLQSALAERATVDLKPFMTTARRGVETALAEFRESISGVSVNAGVTDLRVTSVAFDSKTLRVFGEARGNVRVAVSSLPK